MYKAVRARPALRESRNPRIISRRYLITYYLIVQYVNYRESLRTPRRPALLAAFAVSLSCASRGCAASSRESIKREAPRGRATPRVLSDGVGPCVRAGSIVSTRYSLSRVSLIPWK